MSLRAIGPALLLGWVFISVGCGARTDIEAFFDAASVSASDADAGASGPDAYAETDSAFDTAADVTMGETADAPADAADADACDGSICGVVCVDLASDPANCGACGNACPNPPNGMGACAAGSCGVACDSGFHVCSGACASNVALATCGASCSPCPAPPEHASATCDGASCTWTCDPGYVSDSGGCIVGPPRPLAPLSTSTATSQHPTLRWSLPPGADGARVELCADRACKVVLSTFDAVGTSVRISQLLSPGVAFWRLFARFGATTATIASSTWEFFIPRRDAPIDTSSGTTLDWNGDGLADFAVGSSGLVLVPNGGSQGRIYLYQGAPAAVTTAPTAHLDGLKQGEWFGHDLASAGDVNGDGYGDLVVGAWGGEKIYVYFGGAAGLPTAPSQTILGPDPGDPLFGASVASAGDVNGDGYADVVVGAWNYKEVLPSGHADGRAYVFHGGPAGLALAPATTIDAPVTGAWFGQDVADAGDVNGDGYGDVIVGAKFDDATPGHAYVFFGSASGTSGKPDVTLQCPAPSGAGFGASVASAGDVNADGFSDVVVGTESNLFGVKAAYVYLGGSAGTNPVVATAVAPIAHGWTRVASAGDFDADGYGDVVVGDPDGEVVTLYAGGASGLSPSPMATWKSSSVNFGFSVSRAGDLNGDGFGEVLVSALPIPDPGSVLIFAGSSRPPALTPLASLSAPGDSDFGRCVGGSSGP